MIIIALAVLGLILGSFVNAMVWRFHEQDRRAGLPLKQKRRQTVTDDQLSMVKGRSMCSNCHHELAPKDLVPLFSWLWLRGRCRYCHKRIQDSPLIEVILPLLFVLSYLVWPLSLRGLRLYEFIFWLIFLIGFVALAAYDLRWYLLPDRIVWPLVAVALIELAGKLLFFNGGWTTLWGAIWGVVIASGLFYVLYQLSDGAWIGGGDVKLGLVLGILVGGPLAAILLLFIASVLGTLVALPLLLTGRAGRSSRLPFGPFLLLAAVVVTLFGSHLLDGYYRLFGI